MSRYDRKRRLSETLHNHNGDLSREDQVIYTNHIVADIDKDYYRKRHISETFHNHNGDLSKEDLELYKKHFTAHIETDFNLAILEKEYMERMVQEQVFFRCLIAHGTFYGADFIRIPKNTIVLALGDEGQILFDRYRQSYKSRAISYDYMLLFIQYLNFLAARIPRGDPINRGVVQKYWRFFRHSILQYWSLIWGDEFYWKNSHIFEINPYFEGDILPDFSLTFEDEKWPMGIYKWEEYRDRVKSSLNGVELYKIANKYRTPRYTNGSLESTIGNVLDIICNETTGTGELRIVMMRACRALQTPLMDLSLFPGQRTLFKNVLNHYESILQNSKEKVALLKKLTLERYDFDLDYLITPQSREIKNVLQTLFEAPNVFTPQSNAMKQMEKLSHCEKLFYKKYCFANTSDTNSSRFKKNQIILYSDADSVPGVIHKNRQFLNTYVPVRDLNGIPYYFGLSERFPGQETYELPPSRRDLHKMPTDQMYYYPYNRQGEMLSAIFDKDNRRSMDISLIHDKGIMYHKSVRVEIFVIWKKIAEPLIHKTVWPEFQKAMKLAFVDAIPLRDLKVLFPSFEEFFNRYKLFHLQWMSDNLSMHSFWHNVDISEMKDYNLSVLQQPWLTKILVDPWMYLSSTTTQTGPWRHLRRGLTVANLTPLEYALCNFYLHGHDRDAAVTLYDLISSIYLFGDGGEGESTFVTNEDMEQAARELSTISDPLPHFSYLYEKEIALRTKVGSIINEGKSVDLNNFPLSILTRLKLEPFKQDTVVSHIMSRLPTKMVYEIKRDYVIGDFSSIFTVRYRLINKLEELTDKYFGENRSKSFTTFKEVFSFYFNYYARYVLNFKIPAYKYIETFNFFQLLLLEQELNEVK